MDEPHPYVDIALQDDYESFRDKNPYPLGDLDYPADEWQEKFISSSVPQLVNEYGWMWLWRDGSPSKLTVKNYNYYLGENASNDDRRELQAYWLQLQTEWLRSERSVAGVLQFCYLTNNYGFTGDAFIENIKNLSPSPMLKWFKHCFAPSAAFIDLTDERYMKHTKPHAPSSLLNFNVFAINDQQIQANGNVTIRLLDSSGKEVLHTEKKLQIPGYGKTIVPFSITLPDKAGGYLLVCEYTADLGKAAQPVISRRYIKVGAEDGKPYKFYSLEP
jgi:hypothetical protein